MVVGQVRVVVIIAEGIPENLTRRMNKLAARRGVVIIGPATVGGIKPGCIKLGTCLIQYVLYSTLESRQFPSVRVGPRLTPLRSSSLLLVAVPCAHASLNTASRPGATTCTVLLVDSTCTRTRIAQSPPPAPAHE